MNSTMTMGNGGRRNGLRPFVWGTAACLLALPWFAMRFFPQAGVEWTAFDFTVMGTLLAVACGLYELGAWLSGNLAYRAGFGLAVLTGFMTVWVNLAVGMLGAPFNEANLMFAGVLSIAALGALIARFKPHGMGLAMTTAGIAQLLAAGAGHVLLAWPEWREIVLTALFALPWFASAMLFRRAA